MTSQTHEMQMNWWGLTIRGIITTLFGLAAIFWPQETLVTLVYLFSALILISGVARLITGVSRIGHHQLGFLTLLMGLLELGVGVYLIRHPHVTFATFILLAGFLLIVNGVFGVVGALFDKTTATERTLSLIVGAIAVLAGIVVLFQPEASGVAFVWILGLYALLTGPLMIAMSLDIRKELEA
ncbi:DUF308 domain-containing protein [Candidatus Saccharibacteria bacterium]|nr:DUF308 domain-containing protein [Candidatus Saccharibacteria bacterium]